MAETNAFARDGEVAFRAPDGEVVFVPEANANAAARDGFAPLTPEQFAQAEHEAKFDRPGAATAAGVARGLTLGASDLLAPELGIATPQELQGLREVNPIASGIGEAGGAIGSALVPGGALGLAGKAAARGGAALAARAGTGLAGRIAAKAAPVALQSAAEGALIGTQQAVTDIALDQIEPGSAAATIAKRTLAGAALGGITGLGMLGAGAAIGGTARKLAKLGKTKTQSAKAAESLLRTADEATTQSTGLSRYAELQDEIVDIQGVTKALRQKQRAGTATPQELEALAQADIVGKQLTVERGQIQRELAGLRATSRRQETTVKTTWRGRKQAELDDIAKKIEKGETLTLKEQVDAMQPQMSWLTRMNDELNAGIDKIRNEQRALAKATGAIDDDANELAATLWQKRELVRSKIKRHQQTVQRIERADAFSHGQDLSRALGAELTDATADSVTRTVRTIERAAAGRQQVTLPREALKEFAERRAPILQQLAQQQTAGEFSRLANWRSASVLMGAVIGDIPGALIGGLAGFQGVQRAVGGLLSGTLSGMSAGARIAAKGAAAARIGGTSALLKSSQDVAAFAEDVQAAEQDPDIKYEASLQGYLDSGIPSLGAQSLAAMQAGKILAVRAALPQDANDPVQRQRLRYTVDATENPRGIADRIGNDAVRQEDADAFAAMAPDAAEQIASIAKQVLDDDPSMTPRKRRSLQRLAGMGDRAAAETLELQQHAFGDDEQAPAPKGTANLPSLATSVQSAATTLGA